MKREISINKDAVSKAARWVVCNNPYMKAATIDMVEKDIQRSVDRVVDAAKKKWEMSYSGTAGFTIFFMPEDENYGTIEVLVDPAVGSDYEFEVIWEG